MPNPDSKELVDHHRITRERMMVSEKYFDLLVELEGIAESKGEQYIQTPLIDWICDVDIDIQLI